LTGLSHWVKKQLKVLVREDELRVKKRYGIATVFVYLVLSGCGTVMSSSKVVDTGNSIEIFGEVTWSGKITVEKNIRIMPKASLTLEPGTVLVFSQNSSKPAEKLGIVVEKKGQIVSKGTNENPITFTVSGERKTDKSWNGIVMNGSKESVFFFTHFLFGKNAIRSKNTDIMIYQSLFRFCSNPLYVDGGNIRVVSSFFEKNSTAISFKNADPKIVRNTFSGNKRGIYFIENSARGVVHENNFLNNETNIEISASEKNAINLVQNFWGTVKQDEIKRKIRWNQNFIKRGGLRIRPFAFAPFKHIENAPKHMF